MDRFLDFLFGFREPYGRKFLSFPFESKITNYELTDYFDNDTHQWVEGEKNWSLKINNNDVDITIDDDVVNVSYKNEENTKFGKKLTSVSFSQLFPENSVHETVKAKRVDGSILITVDKAVIDTPKKVKKLEIE